MDNDDIFKTYNQLFPDEEKAAAFDEIAKHFYARNFGTMSKSDMETLMFSLYIERIISQKDKKYSAYSDYTLAKELGITQSKVSNLKVKKQLQYPHEYDWLSSFAEISERAKYEGGNIKIQIPDINLYYDIKNAIEEAGGFVEVTLNRGLLVVPLSYFLDFMVTVAPDDDREKLRKAIKDGQKEHQFDQKIVEKETVGTYLQKLGITDVVALFSNVVSIINGVNSKGMRNIYTIVSNVLEAINK